jgi:hypothetical protein
LVALQTSFNICGRYRLYTNVQAAHPAMQRSARFMNNDGRANQFLFGRSGFSLREPLDRFPTCAQDRLYTNNIPGG